MTIKGRVHNVVIIATENDSAYAYDADSGGAPLWKASMVDVAHGAGAGETLLNSAAENLCADLEPLVGIAQEGSYNHKLEPDKHCDISAR
jgi:hypothetical protein